VLQLALLWSLARTPLPRRSAARSDAAAART